MRKILLVLILTISLGLLAQTELTINITPHSSTYNVLYPVNFNPDEPSLQPNLFMVTINGDVPTNAILYCKMTWNEEVAEITLNPLGQFPTVLSSSDIINSAPSGFTIEQTFDAFLENIEDIIIDTGRMPDGNYVFEIGIYENDQYGTLISNLETAVVVIRSPISISLITPGNPIGLGVSNISEQYPNFIWYSNLGEYKIKIYELDRGYETVEEIEMLEPHYMESEIMGTSFSYPPSAPEFEFNKTYAWQISARTSSPNISSESVYKSTMYLFRLSNSSSEEMNLQILINFLNQLDIDGVGEVISLLEAGYTIDNIIWRGNEIEPAGLMEILEDISNGNITPTQITVE